MGTANRVEVGDTVKVFVSDGNSITGIVDYIPVATGDSWIVLDIQDRMPIYIQIFSYMCLLDKSK